jgi:hypothetical protein
MVDAVVLYTMDGRSMETKLTGLHVPDIQHEMVGTEHLKVVDRLHHGNSIRCPSFNHGRCQLEIDIIEMDDVRPETTDHLTKFSLCFKGVNNVKRIQKPFDPCLMEIHGFRVKTRGISNGVLRILHAEILHLMASSMKFFSDF